MTSCPSNANSVRYEHVAVVGAGIAGMATAWYLRKAGCRVTLLARGDEVADAASGSNGGHFSLSEVAPWTSRGFVAACQQPADPNASVYVKNASALSPQLLSHITRAAAPEQFTASAKRNLSLALITLRELKHLRSRAAARSLPLNYSQRSAGGIRLYSCAETMEEAVEAGTIFAEAGVETIVLPANELVEHVPLIAPAVASGAIIGGILSPQDETGDVAALCRELREGLVAEEARILLGTDVRRVLVADDGNVCALEISPANAPQQQVDGDSSANHHRARSSAPSTTSRIDVDAVVFATGLPPTNLLKPVAQSLSATALPAADCNTEVAGMVPTFPLKGYCLTFDVPETAKDLPDCGLSWPERRMVYTNLGSKVRVAGLLDVGDLDPTPDPARVQNITDSAHQLLGENINARASEVSCGFRPTSVDGSPIVGGLGAAGTASNVFVNCAYGPHGLALAVGGSYLLAQLIARHQLDATLALFTPYR